MNQPQGTDGRDALGRVDLAAPAPLTTEEEAEIPEARFVHVVASAAAGILGGQIVPRFEAAWAEGPSIGSLPVVRLMRELGEPLFSTIALLAESESPTMRRRCIEALSHVGVPALPASLELLLSNSEAARRAGGTSLRAIASQHAPLSEAIAMLVRTTEASGSLAARQAGVTRLRTLLPSP